MDRPVDLFRHSILHGCVTNGLLMPGIVGEIMFEGLRGILTSVVGLECLHSLSRPILYLSYPSSEDLERFVFGPYGVGLDLPCNVI